MFGADSCPDPVGNIFSIFVLASFMLLIGALEGSGRPRAARLASAVNIEPRNSLADLTRATGQTLGMLK